MKWMKNIWSSLIHWWYGESDDKKGIYQLLDVVDQPLLDEVETNIVYYIGDKDWKWLLMFQCPCGCDDIIYLSLLEKSKQNWSIEGMNNNIFSIHPSINRQVGCRSHFFITHNEVRWCERLET